MQQQDRSVLDVATATGLRYGSLIAVLTGRMTYSSCVGPVSEALGIVPTLVSTWVRRPRNIPKTRRLFEVTDAWLSAVRAAMASDNLSHRDVASAAHISHTNLYVVLRGGASRSSYIGAVARVLRLEDVDGVWQRRKK